MTPSRPRSPAQKCLGTPMPRICPNVDTNQISPDKTALPDGFDATEHLEPIAGSTYSNDEADAVVAQIISRYHSGALSEEDTRARIATVLYQTGIHREVAGRASGVNTSQRLELSDRLSELLTKKVLIGGDRPFYDLNVATGSSASGWAREFAKAAVQSEVRNIRRGHERAWGEWHDVLIDPTLDWDSLEGLAMVTGNKRDGQGHRRVEDFRERQKRMGEGERYQRAAGELAEIIGVPVPLRPLDMEARDLLLGHLYRDHTLAMRTLAQYAAEQWPAQWPTTRREPVTESLMATARILWSPYTPDTADLLLSRGDSAPQTLAIAAVAPRPRPSKTLISDFAALISTQAITARSRLGWRALATALAESWVSSECDAVARSAFVSVEARRKAETGHLVSRRRLHDLVKQAAAHQTAPMGDTPETVMVMLAELASQAFGWSLERAA